MFWREFKTKKAAGDAIRAIVNGQPFVTPFESPLISDLIFERHYFCSLRGLRPLRFRKLPGYGSYTFEGDFSGCVLPVPLGWHPVSWVKCLSEPPAAWDVVERAMRDRSEPAKTSHRMAHVMCEACSENVAQETHHERPSFHEITETIRRQVTPGDVSECLLEWDWFRQDSFALPEGHRITRLFDEIHATAVLQALCHSCHNKTKGNPNSLPCVARAPRS